MKASFTAFRNRVREEFLSMVLRPLLLVAVMAVPAVFGWGQAEAAPPSTLSWQVRGNGAYASAFSSDECRWAFGPSCRR